MKITKEDLGNLTKEDVKKFTTSERYDLVLDILENKRELAKADYYEIMHGFFLGELGGTAYLVKMGLIDKYIMPFAMEPTPENMLTIGTATIASIIIPVVGHYIHHKIKGKSAIKKSKELEERLESIPCKESIKKIIEVYESALGRDKRDSKDWKRVRNIDFSELEGILTETAQPQPAHA